MSTDDLVAPAKATDAAASFDTVRAAELPHRLLDSHACRQSETLGDALVAYVFGTQSEDQCTYAVEGGHK